MRGWLSLWLLIAAALTPGCDGVEEPELGSARRDAWAAQPPPSVASVRSCLRRHELTVYGRPDPQPRPDWDASDHGELYAGGAALYFYSSHRRAGSLGRLLKRHVTTANDYYPDRLVTLVSRGSVRVIYEGAQIPAAVDNCLRDAPAWDGR